MHPATRKGNWIRCEVLESTHVARVTRKGQSALMIEIDIIPHDYTMLSMLHRTKASNSNLHLPSKEMLALCILCTCSFVSLKSWYLYLYIQVKHSENISSTNRQNTPTYQHSWKSKAQIGCHIRKPTYSMELCRFRSRSQGCPNQPVLDQGDLRRRGWDISSRRAKQMKYMISCGKLMTILLEQEDTMGL